MSEKYRAVTGLSYKVGDEWKLAAEGDAVELSPAVANDALARGIVKPMKSKPKEAKP